jgi:hypothetical protein
MRRINYKLVKLSYIKFQQSMWKGLWIKWKLLSLMHTRIYLGYIRLRIVTVPQLLAQVFKIEFQQDLYNVLWYVWKCLLTSVM